MSSSSGVPPAFVPDAKHVDSKGSEDDVRFHGDIVSDAVVFHAPPSPKKANEGYLFVALNVPPNPLPANVAKPDGAPPMGPDAMYTRDARDLFDEKVAQEAKEPASNAPPAVEEKTPKTVAAKGRAPESRTVGEIVLLLETKLPAKKEKTGLLKVLPKDDFAAVRKAFLTFSTTSSPAAKREALEFLHGECAAWMQKNPNDYVRGSPKGAFIQAFHADYAALQKLLPLPVDSVPPLQKGLYRVLHLENATSQQVESLLLRALKDRDVGQLVVVLFDEAYKTDPAERKPWQQQLLDSDSARKLHQKGTASLPPSQAPVVYDNFGVALKVLEITEARKERVTIDGHVVTALMVGEGAQREAIVLSKHFASGSFGAVRVGIGDGGRKRAVKVLRRVHKPNAKTRVSEQRQIEKEVRMMAKAGVFYPRVYQTNKNVFIVMDLIDSDLDFLRKAGGTYAPADRLLLTGDLATQLIPKTATIHRRNVVHRDIKPANILINGGEVRIGDVGLATEGASQNDGGTPIYQAPETFSHRPSDSRVDTFSAGVMLLETLNGRHPMHGFDHRRLPHLWQAVLTAAIMKARENHPSGSDLIRLIERMVEINPDLRPRMEDLEEELDRQPLVYDSQAAQTLWADKVPKSPAREAAIKQAEEDRRRWDAEQIKALAKTV